MLLASRIFAKNSCRRFSTSAFMKRTEELLDEAAAQVSKTEEISKAWLAKENDDRLPADGVYRHPYCTKEHPIALHNDHMIRTMMEVLGPEPVSPHYNSIEEFGKWFNYFFVFLGFTVAMRSHQNHAFGYCVLNMMFGLEIWIYVIALYIMKASVMVVPNPWKLLWKKYNMDGMLNSIYELEEEGVHEKKKVPLAQVDYLRIHQEYLGTKAQLLQMHLENSRLELKKHTYERALSMLRSAERYEEDNMNELLDNMLKKSMEKLTSEITGPNAKDIRKAAFASAINGIKKGKMHYEGDPLLPILLKEIETFQQSVEAMTEEQVANMVSLKPEQKQAIAENDAKMEESFLTSPPPLKHPKVLASERFKSI